MEIRFMSNITKVTSTYVRENYHLVRVHANDNLTVLIGTATDTVNINM